MPTPADSSREFRQTLRMETPENVTLDYEVAGMGSRTLAVIADFAVISACILIAGLAIGLSVGLESQLGTITLIAFLAIGAVSYFALFEGLRQGQTPGKRWMGIRVINDAGRSLTIGTTTLRALLMPADLFCAVGGLLILVHPKGKRLADLVAGTVVVRDHPVDRTTDPRVPEKLIRDLDPSALSDPEFQLLSRFAARVAELDESSREELAEKIAQRLQLPIRTPGQSTARNLAAAYQAELDRRRKASQSPSMTAPPDRRRAAAERLHKVQATRWMEFEKLALKIARSGLDSAGGDELVEFAARYREITADLARARTYRSDPTILSRLERLAAIGHSLLYQERQRSWRRLLRFLTIDCPLAVYQTRPAILLAVLTFVIPMAGGYLLLKSRPEIAEAALPVVLLDRAIAGQAREESDLGFVQAERENRLMLAVTIIANNTRVAFNCFAGGVFLGVGSLAVLGYNGAALGAAAGHFSNSDLTGYFWTFIAGHGVLEIFAICLAGAAGFLLGFAVIAPGARSRATALAHAGHQAIRLITTVTLLLLVAGLIEGLISASGAAVSMRLTVVAFSAAIIAMIVLWGKYLHSRPNDLTQPS